MKMFNSGLVYPKANTTSEPSKAENEMRFSLLKDTEIQKAKKEKKDLRTMDIFSTDYKHSIEHDKRKTLDEMRKNSSDKSFDGELLADIMTFRMNNYHWLGEKTTITQTSEFDDRFNHADIVCEFDNSDSGEESTDPTYLAIDCTVTENPEVLEKKTGYTSRRFHEMEMLPDIKYHRKAADGSIGIKNIPRVIVAIEKSRLEEICKTMLLADNNSETAIAKTRQSYLQLYMLYEIGAQLNKQLHFVAEKFKSPIKQKHAFDSLSKTYATVQRLIEKKESSFGTEVSERAWKEFESSEVAMFLATDDLSLAA